MRSFADPNGRGSAKHRVEPHHAEQLHEKLLTTVMAFPQSAPRLEIKLPPLRVDCVTGLA